MLGKRLCLAILVALAGTTLALPPASAVGPGDPGTVSGRISFPAGYDPTQATITYYVIDGTNNGMVYEMAGIHPAADGSFVLLGVEGGIADVVTSWPAAGAVPGGTMHYDGNQDTQDRFFALGGECSLTGIALTVAADGTATRTATPKLVCPRFFSASVHQVGYGVPKAGDTVQVSTIVNNSTGVQLNGVTVTSADVTLAGGSVGDLPVYGSGSARGSHVLTPAEVAAGSYAATVSAHATYGGAPVWFGDVTTRLAIPPVTAKPCAPVASEHLKLAHDQAALKTVQKRLKKAKKAHRRLLVRKLATQQKAWKRRIAADLAAIARRGC